MPSSRERANLAGRSVQLAIITACEKYWTLQEQGNKHRSKCNEFVIAVAAEMNVTIRGPMANDIYGELHSKDSQWSFVGKGTKHAMSAGLLARSGKLVLAASKGSPHGHVAVVVDWDEAANRPRAYWGALNRGGKADGKLSESWSRQRLVPGVYSFTLDDWKKNPTIGTAYDAVEFFSTDVAL